MLITGHTGFKGSWLTLLLKDLGAEVVGLSLPPVSSQSLFVDAKIGDQVSVNFFEDIRDELQVSNAIGILRPDYVFHLAAQAYVRRSVRNPIESITTNITGTANVLLSSLACESVIGVAIATTDKVYQNLSRNKSFEESDKLGGIDPYSASKAASEIIINSINIANNPSKKPITTVRAGTLRGFHFQNAPFEEIKLVTCVSGKVFDAILDLRPNSKTYLKTFTVVLDLDSNKSIYIAKGVAHAYLTLEDNSSVTYQVSEKYAKEYTSGVKYSDPKVKVEWPIIPKIVSKNDLSWEPL